MTEMRVQAEMHLLDREVVMYVKEGKMGEIEEKLYVWMLKTVAKDEKVNA